MAQELKLGFCYGQSKNFENIPDGNPGEARFITSIREVKEGQEIADNVASLYVDIENTKYLITPRLASQEHSGLVSTKNQEFQGNKVFNGMIEVKDSDIEYEELEEVKHTQIASNQIQSSAFKGKQFALDKNVTLTKDSNDNLIIEFLN